MRKIVLFVLLLGFTVGFSQEVKQDSIYIMAEKMPEYPDGGIDGFREFVAENFQPLNNLEDIKGTIISSFIIDTEGNLRNIEILRDLGHGTAEETIRVLKLSPKWIPGQIQGKNVNVKYTLPIRIEIKAAVIVDEEKINNHFAMNSDGTYNEAETMPEYPDGGIDGFRRFIIKNVNATGWYLENPNRGVFRAKNINVTSTRRFSKKYKYKEEINFKSRIVIQFIVDEKGSLTNVKSNIDNIESFNIGYSIGKEVERFVKMSKKWKPGTIKGKPVKVRYNLPIDIKIRNSKFIGDPLKIEYESPAYTNVDIKAKYLDGGEKGFISYLLKNIKFGKPHENIDDEIKLNFEFVVESNGKITNVRLLESISKNVDKQLIRLIKKSKKWIPAFISNESVRSLYTISQPMKISVKNIYKF